MKHLQRVSGVKRTGKPSISEGQSLLTQHPRIRKEIRFRSDRFELKGKDGLWRVYHRSWARLRLTTCAREFHLVGRDADSVLMALRAEGAGLESDDPNPVLLTNPEFKRAVRRMDMPNVRRFFCFQGRTFYELHEGRWLPLRGQQISARITERLVEELGHGLHSKCLEACIEELKLEGKAR